MRRPADTVSEEETMNQEGSLAVSEPKLYLFYILSSYLWYSSRSADPIPMKVFVIAIQIQFQPFRQPGEPTIVLTPPEGIDPVEQAAIIEQVLIAGFYIF